MPTIIACTIVAFIAGVLITYFYFRITNARKDELVAYNHDLDCKAARSAGFEAGWTAANEDRPIYGQARYNALHPEDRL